MGHQGINEQNRLLLGRITAVACVVVLLVATGSAWAGAGTDRAAVETSPDTTPATIEDVAAAGPPLVVTSAVADVTTTTTTTPATTVPSSPPPPPPPPTTAAPPSPTTVPAPPPTDPLRATYERSVPAAWRAAIPVELVPTGGSTSWAYPNGRILVSSYHRNAGDRMLRNVLAHEFGHLIAFRFGSMRYNGAPPAGWPEPGYRPEEVWAKCVAKVFTGDDDHSFGMAPCGGEQLRWASAWLAAGPPR